MKLGKFIITQELASDSKKLDALTAFISTNVVILEKIVAFDVKTRQVVWMIGLCLQFEDCPEAITKIPEYEFVFEESAMTKSGLIIKIVKL